MIEELPLFYISSEKLQFAKAISYLDKNIQQLLSIHGIAANEKYHILKNLSNLVAAAYSGTDNKILAK